MKLIVTGAVMIFAVFMVIVFSGPGDFQGSTDNAVMPGLTAVFGGTGSGARADSSYISGAVIAALRNKHIVNPVIQDGDPYISGDSRIIEPPGDRAVTTAVCAFRYLDAGRTRYQIKTMSDESAAGDSGYTITHRGRCGTCSTLQDLAVYLQRRDLTYAVRACSFRMMREPTISCLEEIGFSHNCALTWYYNIRNTGRCCLWTCLGSWLKREPLNRRDGSLNGCLQCDEDMSGPIFKYRAGRTRRNSGILSEIGRRGDEVFPVTHDYY